MTIFPLNLQSYFSFYHYICLQFSIRNSPRPLTTSEARSTTQRIAVDFNATAFLGSFIRFWCCLFWW